jgi:hypothetical protein
VGALVLVIAVVLSFMLKEVPLRMVSGQQARAAAESADAESANAESANAEGIRLALSAPVDAEPGGAAVEVPRRQ